MSRNYYSEINLHLVWHTKESEPLLVPDVEEFTHQWIRRRIVASSDVFIHEVGGTENHVHLCVSIFPTVTISDFIGQVKGACSHDVNEQFRHRGKVLQWQSGYGVVSFGSGDLEWVCGYVRAQKARHAAGTVDDRLERITELESEAEAASARSPVNGAQLARSDNRKLEDRA